MREVSFNIDDTDGNYTRIYAHRTHTFLYSIYIYIWGQILMLLDIRNMQRSIHIKKRLLSQVESRAFFFFFFVVFQQQQLSRDCLPFAQFFFFSQPAPIYYFFFILLMEWKVGGLVMSNFLFIRLLFQPRLRFFKRRYIQINHHQDKRRRMEIIDNNAPVDA